MDALEMKGNRTGARENRDDILGLNRCIYIHLEQEKILGRYQVSPLKEIGRYHDLAGKRLK
jgi:hypothetical protein